MDMEAVIALIKYVYVIQVSVLHRSDFVSIMRCFNVLIRCPTLELQLDTFIPGA